MKKRNILYMLIFCLCTTACRTASSLKREDLSGLGEIHIIEREEGSGTRQQFDALLKIDEDEAAKTMQSTEEVITYVKNNPSAIGYAALSAASDNTIRTISIDGITPSAKTIRSGRYPLSRRYFLAWLGEQTDLEKEFIAYVKTAGQKYVEEEAVPVHETKNFLSLRPSGTITIAGSSSMTALMEKLAADYKTYNPDADITIKESDSSSGLTDAMQKRADIAMSSRDLKDYEQEILSYEVIGMDAIAVIVNQDNPLTSLTSDELKKIYQGKIKSWNELN